MLGDAFRRGGGGGGVNRFSDNRIPPKKLFGFWIWRIFYTDLRILFIQRIANLPNILAQIVDFACNLVRILDCDFIVELLADPNLDKIIVGSADFASNFCGSADLYTPIPPVSNCTSKRVPSCVSDCIKDAHQGWL